MSDVVFKTLTGSRLYNLDEENSDTDYTGVCIPELRELFGVESMSNAKHDKIKNDDVTYFSIQQFCKLLANGNFIVLESVFAPEDKIIHVDENFRRMFLENKKEYLGPHILNPLVGFAKSNSKNLQNKVPSTQSSRYELIQKHGYDTKYAMHTVRILNVGQHYCHTGEFIVDQTDMRQYYLDIKNGKYSFEKISFLIEEKIKTMALYTEDIHFSTREPYLKRLYDSLNDRCINFCKDWYL